MKRYVEHEKCVDIEEFRNGMWVVVSCNIRLGISVQKWNKYLKYGITEDDYSDLFKLQKGMCAICGKTSKRKLVVDHDHKSMAIRGLLCNSCNVGIGFLKDDPEITNKATAYLLRN